MRDLLKKLKSERLNHLERIAIRNQIIDAAQSSRGELIEALEKERSEPFRIELLHIFGATRDEFFEEAIRRVIETEKSEQVLQTAATNLGKIGAKNSFPMLVDLLNHESPYVRLGAVYGLKALGDKRAIKFLLKSLDDHLPIKVWWSSPKAGDYSVANEASIAIDALAGTEFKGDKTRIEKWLAEDAQ